MMLMLSKNIFHRNKTEFTLFYRLHIVNITQENYFYFLLYLLRDFLLQEHSAK